MEIKKGKNRIAVLFPSIKIAIKIPKIHLFKAIRLLLHYTLKDRKNFKNYFSWPIEFMAIASLRSLLLKAIYQNWNEYYFHKKTGNPLLQPTYFSLFGFLNIQKYGKPCDFPESELFWQLLFLTDKNANEDLHHFGERNNFCFQDGKLRMVDYGSCKTRAIITKHGKRIFESFNPNYKFSSHGRVN